MCNMASFVEHIKGCRLGDHEDDPQLWSDDVIAKAVKEAVAAIAGIRPDVMAVEKNITAPRGTCVVSFCQECESITDVISADGNDCQEIEEEDEDDDKSLDFLDCYYKDCDLPNCENDDIDSEKYNAGEYKKYESSPCTIRFENPTPKDRDVTIKVMCVPKDLDYDNLPEKLCQKFFSAIVDNTLFRLYSIDKKSGTNLRIADSHYKSYLDFMNARLASDLSISSGDYSFSRRKR